MPRAKTLFMKFKPLSDILCMPDIEGAVPTLQNIDETQPFDRFGRLTGARLRASDARKLYGIEEHLGNGWPAMSKWSVSGTRRMAEREGFEPSVPFLVHLISNQARSATLSPLL